MSGSNSNPAFYGGQIPDAPFWNASFGDKVDAVGGYLTNPQSVGGLFTNPVINGGVATLDVLTVGGVVTLGADPVLPLQAVTKQYADAISGLPEAPTGGATYGRTNATTWTPVLALAGGTLTGALMLAADPLAALGAATRQYVDARAWQEAPNDGSLYGRGSGAWVAVLAMTGGTLSGPLTLAADPAAGLGAATKQYVDGLIAALDARLTALGG